MEIFLEWKKSNKIDFPTYSTTRRKNLQKYSTAKDTDFQYSFSPFDNILSFSLHRFFSKIKTIHRSSFVSFFHHVEMVATLLKYRENKIS